MPTLTDDDQKSAIDQKIEDGHGAYASAGLDQLESFANDPANHDNPSDVSSLGKAESAPDKGSMNYTGNGGNTIDKPRLQKAVGFAKKRGGIIGLISIFGIGGGILAGFFGPASLLINLTENFSISNDSSSTAMERRFMKVFNNMTKGDVVCANSTKNIKCKMGKISNKALRQLKKKGVTAIFDGGTSNSTRYDGKRTGYPQKNPSHYEFDMGEGKSPKRVAAKDLTGFLANKENRKLASKVLGTRGAFNLRVKAWTGKHITNKLFKKFGIKRNGGLADGTNKKGTAKERLSNIKKKLKTSIPGMETADKIAGKITDKINKQTGKAKKGGVGYLIAVAGCITVKAPGYVAAGVAAIQLAQLLPIVMDVVMSPGSKAKASGVDKENSITADDADAIGTLLTNKTENSSGNMTSALDSQYLLAAMGVNKSKPGVSTKFAPGYGLLSNPVVRTAQDVSEASEPACNVIMSPTAMYTAMAVDMATTVAASATIVGGLIKIAASWLISELVGKLIETIAETYAKDWITQFAQNDAIPEAQGEELGDVLGISAAAFFSSGGMAHHLPTLSVDQLGDFTAMQQESENFQREMDIASLSPFDTSSRYTFMGSILYNIQMAAFSSGGYGITSLFSSFSKLPSALSTNVGAAVNFSSQYCGYAGDYYLDTDSQSTTPAINMAGLPCTGITKTQANMSTAEAINLLQDEGWICNADSTASGEGEDCPEIPEGATIEELMPKSGDNEDGYSGNGFIRKDNLLYEFINSCSNPDTGDYIFNASGCVAPVYDSLSGGTQGQNCLNTNDDEYTNDDGDVIHECVQPEDGEDEVEGVQNPKAIQAIAVFLLDYQILQSINGEDEEEGGGSSSDFELGTPDNVREWGEGWSLKPNTDYSGIACAPGTSEEGIYDVAVQTEMSKIKLCTVTVGGNSVRVASLVSANIKAMMEAAAADGVKLASSSDFRSNEEQQSLYNANCSGGSCSPPTARPGSSQHELGLAVDWRLEGGNTFCFPNATCPAGTNAGYDWMMAHSKEYGFIKLDSEAWHFSTSGW